MRHAIGLGPSVPGFPRHLSPLAAEWAFAMTGLLREVLFVGKLLLSLQLALLSWPCHLLAWGGPAGKRLRG
jgi:hypothetical protein